MFRPIEMITAARLQIALEIANAPDVMDWPDAHVDLARELLLSYCGTSTHTRAEARKFSRAAFAELKEWTEGLLDQFLVDGRVIVGLTGDDMPLVFEVQRDRQVAGVSGSLRARYIVTAAFLLASEGQRLRRCLDATCRRFFLKVGKKKHCSNRCARRVYMRRYRRESV